ncbi:sulfotransferase family protein [Salinisphaera orenii]|uniref:sulfotransferase family protein n=1 Tax=Salinisphaera orenii TaxID=856731 RepID=UPI000DBE6E4D
MTPDAGSAHASTDAERATAVVVLGAGRSGTSALTRGLTALGVDLGNKQRAAGGKNPTGFFEDRDVLAIAQRLKKTLGIRGHNLALLGDDVWREPAVESLAANGAQTLARRFANSELWGFKYGRTLRTLPFWQDLLDRMQVEARYVVALRNPLSVARSRARLNPMRGHQAWSDLEWLVNVVPYFDRIAGAPVSVVDFDRLIADPEAQLRRVARDLSLPIGAAEASAIDDYAEAFVQADRPRSRYTRDDLAADPGVNRWVTEGYAMLDAVAGDERALDAAFWRDWSALNAAVHDLAPVLTELDAVNRQRLRARWNPVSPVASARQAFRDWRSR